MLLFGWSWIIEDIYSAWYLHHAACRLHVVGVCILGQRESLLRLLPQDDTILIAVSVGATLQMKSIEQQHSQVGTGDRHNLLVTLRDKESAMQANSMQLIGKRLQLLQEKKTMEVRSLSNQS